MTSKPRLLTQNSNGQMKNKKFSLRILIIILAFGLLATSCASYSVEMQKVDLSGAKVRGQNIPNLQNAMSGVDAKLIQKVDEVMSTFIDPNGRPMGYYTVNFKYGLNSDNLCCAIGLLTTSSFLLFIPNILGMPYSTDSYDTSVSLSIFDSRGYLVESTVQSGKFNFAQGIYYGYDPTKKAGKNFSEELKAALEYMNGKSDSINAMLNAAGPITPQNSAIAKSRITGKAIRGPVEQAGDGKKTSEVKLGGFIGTVGGFEGADVIVNGKDTIGVQAPIGRALIVDANGQYIYLQSTFPMQTVVKCKVTSGDRSQIKKGMRVYLKP